MCLMCNPPAGKPVLPVFVLRRIARCTKKIKKYIQSQSSIYRLSSMIGKIVKQTCYSLPYLALQRESCVHTRRSRGFVLPY